MSDLIELLALENPVDEHDLRPSLTRLLDTLERADAPVPSEISRRLRRATRWWRPRARRPLVLGGASTVVAAAALAAVLISAGGAPSAAQAFPILRTRPTDISRSSVRRALAQWLGSPGSIQAATENAHEFPISDGRAFVIESPDSGTLCLAATATTGITAGHGWVFGCDPTAYAEQSGMILSFGFTHTDLDFIALVPTGGTVTLTDDGTTTPVTVTDGVAAGVVHDNATVALQVDGSTQTHQLDLNSPAPTTSPTS